jgi:pimeloyl-ACP methyl ester carboxylesterase
VLLTGILVPPVVWGQQSGNSPGVLQAAPAPGERILEGDPEGGVPYRLHLSDKATAQSPSGLVLWLHPSGGSANEVVERMAPVFLKHALGLVVVTQKRWVGWTSEEIGALMNKTLPELAKIPGVDTRKPVLWGYSAGGQMALELYWSGPDKLGGLILDAAYPIDMTQYATGKVASRSLPKDPAIQKVPLFVLVGDQDGGAQLWQKVEPDWKEAKVPLSIHYIAGRRHEWLFGKSETEALDLWLKGVAMARLAGFSPKKKAS